MESTSSKHRVWSFNLRHLLLGIGLLCLLLTVAVHLWRGWQTLMAIDSIESRDAWYTVGSDGKYEVDLSGGIRPISDDRLRDLANLPNLKTLTARDAAFTDSGLAFLKGCSQLESLVLDGAPQITDAGSVHFVGLNRLRRLSLEGTGVTADGIARLHKALPKCDIDW